MLFALLQIKEALASANKKNYNSYKNTISQGEKKTAKASKMKDSNKTKEQLINELAELRKQVGEFGKTEAERKKEEDISREMGRLYQSLFDNSPISLWEEDFSDVKTYIDNLGYSGVKNFREYFENHPAAVARCASMVKILHVNKTTLQLYKAGSEEEFRDGLGNIFNEESYDLFREELISIAEGRTIFEGEGITQSFMGDKIHIDLRWSVSPGCEETYSKVFVSIIDITRLKQSEASSLKEMNFLDSTINSLPGIFYLFDEKGHFLRWNRHVEVVTGYSSEEISKMNPLDIIEREERKIVLEKIQEVFIEGQATVEAHLVSKGGKKTPYFLTGLRFTSDNQSYLVGTGFDITILKQAEEKLKQLSEELARSNADLKNFAYVASHDLKKPLQSIEGFVKLMARRYMGKIDAKADEIIEYIYSGVNTMQMLIKDLLEYSQLGAEEKKFRPNDCSLIVKKAIINLQAAVEESSAVVTCDDLPTVVSDMSQMISLFQNLIDNAIKFRGEKSPRIHISAEQKKDEWVFRIRDNGIGIDPRDSEKIFGMFQRLHGSAEYPGTGIGLAICKRIIEGHGGRIWVESEIGNGATFYFTMPRSQKLSK